MLVQQTELHGTIAKLGLWSNEYKGIYKVNSLVKAMGQDRLNKCLRRVLVSSAQNAATTRLEDHEEVHARTAADGVGSHPPSRNKQYGSNVGPRQDTKRLIPRQSLNHGGMISWL